jgi:hypothetical protein
MTAADWITLGVALGTLAVAVGTLRLAGVTRREVELSTRPLLADAGREELSGESILFGAPGRPSFNLGPGHAFFFRLGDDGVLYCSVPFRNIGAGVAVVTSQEAEPAPQLGEVIVSRRFARPGEVVRVNISARADASSDERLAEALRAGEFTVIISYSDADGGQRLVTHADVKRFAVSDFAVRRIAIFREGERKPFAVSESPLS